MLAAAALAAQGGSAPPPSGPPPPPATGSAAPRDAASGYPRALPPPRPIRLDAERRELTRAYAKAHYGVDDWRLAEPQLVVVHFTGSDSDRASLAAFAAARLGGDRPELDGGGPLNVGVHYLIARDGTVWSLLPEGWMGRHAMGYNHTAVGIEMTGSAPDRLGAAQLAACADLVADLFARRPSLRYLCGHHEYTQPGRAHAGLYRELVPGYRPSVKIDPGPAFMAALRARLRDSYRLSPLD